MSSCFSLTHMPPQFSRMKINYMTSQKYTQLKFSFHHDKEFTKDIRKAKLLVIQSVSRSKEGPITLPILQANLRRVTEKINPIITHIFSNEGKTYKIQKLIKLRSYHFPIQYIIGRWQFMSLELKVRPPVLIPRFETEQMMAILFQNEKFLERVKQKKEKNEPFRFLQFGCGSGAIGLALCKHFSQQNIKYSGEMIDIDQKAIKLSLQNMKLNNINKETVTIYQNDMISLLQQSPQTYFEQLDLIISNPPYISVKEYKTTLQRQVRRYESKKALVGDQSLNQNGLFYVEKIVKNVKENCKETQRPMLVMEYGGEDLSFMGKQIDESVVEDYYGRRRFVFLLKW